MVGLRVEDGVDVMVLGTIRVGTQGAVRAIRSEKQALLLAHLALAIGDPVNEHLLVDELWADTPPADPIHALQAHVSRLRAETALSIVHTGGGYQLDPTVTTDAAQFEEILRGADRFASDPESMVGALREALNLWRGEAFENLTLTHALQAQRARLELLRDQVVTRLTDAHLAAGEPEAALPLLRGAVDANPLDERRWGQLMTALHLAGRRSEALDTFTRAREALVEQLGLEPTAELRRLQQEILQDEGPPADTRAAPQTDPPADLAGRAHEWALLTRVWRQAELEQRVAVITGEPGIGKTYLASRFMASFASARVHTGRCHVDRDVPFDPVAQVLRSGCSDLPPPELARLFSGDAAVLTRLVPDMLDGVLAPAPYAGPPPDPQVERHRIQLGMVAWLTEITRSGPVCLMIDDVQWADMDSMHLLAGLWNQPLPLPVLWLVTLRDHAHLGGGPDPALLDAATRPSRAVVHLPLEGLDRSATAELMLAARDGGDAPTPDGSALDEMLAATAGNPLLVLETTRHLAGVGGGFAELVAGSLPPSLTTIVQTHLERVPEGVRDLLETAAVIGEDFDPLLAGMASQRGPREVDHFLALCRKQRLLAPLREHDLRFRFRHALVHAVVLQEIPPVRRAELHLRVAQAVDHHPHLPDRLHLLAHHHLRAVSLVGPETALRHLVAAAELSMEQRAPAAAHAFYRQAHDLVGFTAPLAQRAALHLGMGEAGFAAGIDHREDLLEAARLANQAGDVDRLVRAAVANSRGWYSSITEIDRDRVAVIETALSAIADGTEARHVASRSRLLALWAMENVRDASLRKEVLLRSEQAMDLAEQLGDTDLLGEIMCHRFSVLYATFADPVGTFEFAKRLDALAHSRIDPELQLNAAIAVAQSAMTVGDFTTADPALERSEHLAEMLSHAPRMWLVRTWRATRTAMRGDLKAAEVQATEALELGLASEQPDAFAFFSGQLFTFHHLAGRLPEVVESIEEQVAALDDQLPAWRAAHALALLSVDRYDEARDIVDRFLARRFESVPLDVLFLSALSNLAEVIAALDHAEAARVLYEVLSPHRGLIATNATIDSGPVDLALGRLAHVQGESDLARHHLGVAEEWCRRFGARLWLARVQAAAARR